MKNSPESLDKKIQSLRKELASLVRSKKNLLSKMAKEKYQVKKNRNLKLYKQQLFLSYNGLSSTQIAEKLGCSKHGMSFNIQYAWSEFYPNHFKNCNWLISCYGIIRSLRVSEQPFTCPLREEPYVPESLKEEYEWQKEIHRWIPISESQPTEEDGDIQCSNDGIHWSATGGCRISNNYPFWRKLTEYRMPMYWYLKESR